MKAIIRPMLYSMICALIFFACKKDTQSVVYTPLPVTPGNITTSGDTQYVSAPNITFRITHTSPCAPSNEIYFDSITSSTYPSGTEYKWDFGNGQSATGTYVSHQYQYTAVFTITLSVVVNGTTMQQVTTTVKPYGQYVTPTASFYAQLNNYNDPNYVAFNSQSSVTNGSIVNYFWNWNDGTTSSVATSYTEHRFPEVEQDMNYFVTVTAKSNASCTASYMDTVFVPRSYNNVGGITYTKTPACLPDSQVFTFIQDTTGLPSNTVYEWNIGDGFKYYGSVLKHHFIFTNTYPITCIIKIMAPNGVKLREIVRQVAGGVYALGSDINPIPYINKINYLNAPLNSYLQIDGWGKVGDGHIITKLKWDYGDGTVDSTNTPTVFHQYITTHKTYKLRLTVTASSGCVGSNLFDIVIP